MFGVAVLPAFKGDGGGDSSTTSEASPLPLPLASVESQEQQMSSDKAEKKKVYTPAHVPAKTSNKAEGGGLKRKQSQLTEEPIKAAAIAKALLNKVAKKKAKK